MSSYIGRFAPSPSGSLHFGSLVTALGSYLRARSQQGKWLIRIENIDPPREKAGASTEILKTLEAFGLHWDNSVVYQSQRHHFYQDYLEHLLSNDKAYACRCTRKRIKTLEGFYDGLCRNAVLPSANNAIRFYNHSPCFSFTDKALGNIDIPSSFAKEDFTLKRRDGFYSYQLAVVVDDYLQQVTEVVRGSDLLLNSAHQINLYHEFRWKSPQWLHLPLIVQPDGKKLSKQIGSNPIDPKAKKTWLLLALRYLNQTVDQQMQDLHVDDLLKLASHQFDLNKLPKSHQTFPEN